MAAPNITHHLPVRPAASSVLDTPVVLDPAVGRNGLQMTASARALVVIAHADAASLQHSGHRFVADVLHANGLDTLSFTLHTAAEAAAGVRAPGMVQSKRRIRALLEWLGHQRSLEQRPVALIGIDTTVSCCVAAAARTELAALRSLVLLDGRSYLVPHQLGRLVVPTLFVMGRCDTHMLDRQRSATRNMLAAHRLQMLDLPTRPKAAPGALQAFALLAMNWIERSLPLGKAAADGNGNSVLPAEAAAYSVSGQALNGLPPPPLARPQPPRPQAF